MHGVLIIVATCIEFLRKCTHKEDKKEELSVSYHPPSLRDCDIEVTSLDEPYPLPLHTPRIHTPPEGWENSPPMTPPTPKRMRSTPARFFPSDTPIPTPPPTPERTPNGAIV
jgi:hypothetical protein